MDNKTAIQLIFWMIRRVNYIRKISLTFGIVKKHINNSYTFKMSNLQNQNYKFYIIYCL